MDYERLLYLFLADSSSYSIKDSDISIYGVHLVKFWMKHEKAYPINENCFETELLLYAW